MPLVRLKETPKGEEVLLWNEYYRNMYGLLLYPLINCEGDVHGEDACPAVMPENKIYPVWVLKTETFTKNKSLFLLPEWLRYDKI